MSLHQDERSSNSNGQDAYVANFTVGLEPSNFLANAAHQQLPPTHAPAMAPPMQPTHQQATAGLLWATNPHIGPPFLQNAPTPASPTATPQAMLQPLHHHHHIHPQHQPQAPPQQQQQQTQVYNEFLYNTYTGQPETYSVLPVGHGNFLKVYHCASDNISNNDAAAAAAGIFQQNTSAYQQTQQPQQQQPQAYVTHLPTINHASAAAPQSQFYELFSSPSLLHQPEINMAQPHQQLHQLDERGTATQNAINLTNGNGSNMIINNLVNNWSTNMTGGSYSPFGESNETLQSPTIESTTYMDSAAQYQHNTMSVLTPQTPIKAPNVDVNTANKLKTSTTTTGLLSNSITNLPEVKKRIVAEVKPMRLSYSDVLSKGTVRSMSGSAAGRSNNNTLEVNVSQLRRQVGDDISVQSTRSSKRSPTHETKDLIITQQQSTTGGTTVPSASARSNKKRSNNNSNNSNGIATATTNAAQRQPQQQQAKPQKQTETNNKKRINNANVNNKSAGNGSTIINGGVTSAKTNETNYTKSNQSNFTANATSNSHTANSNPSTRKSSKSSGSASAVAGSSTTNYSNSASNNNSSSSSSSKRYYNSSSNSNSNSNSGYSYSSKRNRNTNYSSNASTLASSAPNRNYELLKRIMSTWWMYTLKLLTWLFYLVYDIIVLGCSMAYERLTHAYIAGMAYAKQLHKELKQNSGKPSIWWTNYWRRFDARFKKNSRWAFWRRFYKKKPPESTSEPFKSGRLPQTGEEAMYSLLNCKGKDAYSILGVPPDSSQEQIRKHYKKIAVLVHPDKNKQAGAEEAFKVLQRAFELIGEPENRLAYDQSLAEALHAEKAWTELHDLLSQLQTKITEAANTIRCSTCAQRHPRKLTDRPHYAARECASCKIRHSAKEGDIWAETSMMGLRWKYLALMEGKVYDITEWANCQKGALSHLEPNSHVVQYRIVRGAQQQQQQQQQQQHQQTSTQHHQYAHERGASMGGGGGGSGIGGKYGKRDIPPSEASLHEFLDNLYSGQHPGQTNPASAYSSGGSTRRRTRRN